MSDVLAQIYATAKAKKRHIVLAEGQDERIVNGAIEAERQGLARITLLGDRADIFPNLPENSAIQIVDPKTSERKEKYAKTLFESRKHKGMTLQRALAAMADPLDYAAMMVHNADADGTLAGAVHTTAETVLAARKIVGVAPEAEIVSSFFLMVLDQPHHDRAETLVFADCALAIEPNSEQLASIAVASADNFRAITGQSPRVAMLSFSTARSAKHARVSLVAQATKLAQAQRKDYVISGEMQFDAAFVPSIGRQKASDFAIQGDANVFVFPNLEAGNIGYKIAQRIGGAKAIGPILQGFAKPVNDLSRGCSVQDVVDMIAITATQVAD